MGLLRRIALGLDTGPPIAATDRAAVIQRLVLQRVAAAKRLGAGTINLRARLHGLAIAQIVQQRGEVLGRQILVVIVVDLHHRRIAARPEALDL